MKLILLDLTNLTVCSKQLEGTAFQTLDVFPSSGEQKTTPTLLGTLETAKPF
jgi:hypothetical protein